MMSTINHNKEISQIYNRLSFLALIQASLEIKEFQFAKQAGLTWLANFPGDLQINFLYAKALLGLNKKELAKSHLEKMINYDIEYLEALSLFSELSPEDSRLSLEIQAVLAYLTGNKQVSKLSSFMVNDLNFARLAAEECDFKQAEKYILNVMAKNPQTPLPAIIHLQTIRNQHNSTLFGTLSSIYVKRWSNSNQIRILSALSSFENGDDVTALENLQWSAAHDSTGQVIKRILGTNHPYKPLWPETMQIYMDIPVPASVAAELGWNKLGNGVEEEKYKKVDEVKKVVSDIDNTSPIGVFPFTQTDSKFDGLSELDVKSLSESFVPGEEEKTTHEMEDSVRVLSDIQDEFDRIAKGLKKQKVIGTDGRFPSYVILTSKSMLTKKYGENTAKVILETLDNMAGKITDLPNWNSILFCPDDPKITPSLGMTPITVVDAWKVKLSLADLDEALEKRGEMIGAVLIIGGNDIIPFHQLPNPTDDSDLYVLSDNPYATIDENYFVPQWPVGRIPDETGPDAVYLIEQIRYLDNEYAYKMKSKKSKTSSFIMSFFQSIGNLFRRLTTAITNIENVGYAAEAWKAPSEDVFDILGKKSVLQLSPPIDHKHFSIKKDNGDTCAYFNLHGIQDGSEWFGQRDFTKTTSDVDYPVALTPSQFAGTSASPEFIFSEACYGCWVNEKKSDESLALKFMETGTRSMVGSTGIAYGAVKKPLVGADLLAQEYWKQLLNGQTSGYALLRAKLNLAQIMTERQGYLDGEDQKTILSFVLYGDPLAYLNDLKHIAKPLFRPKSQPKLKTISDSREELEDNGAGIPLEVMDEVKSIVKSYLPGLDNAQLNLNPQLTNFSLSLSDNNKARQKKYVVDNSQRYVVTLKKSIEKDSYNHIQFARMTFDHKGHMTKLVTSR